MTDIESKQEKAILLKTLLDSREWKELISLNLHRFIEADSMLLASPRAKDALPTDDFLRGRLNAFQFMTNGLKDQLEQWEKEIREFEELNSAGGQPTGVGDPYVPTTDGEEE